MKIPNRARGLLPFLIVASLISCGDKAEFKSGAVPPPVEQADALPQPDDPPPPIPAPPEELKSVQWFLQCQDSPQTPPAAPADGVVIVGDGPHGFHPERLSGTPIEISGSLCPLEGGERRILIVVDVSGSMEDMSTPIFGGAASHSGNDAFRAGSCGRLDAIRALFDSQDVSDHSEVGLITFSGAVVAASSGFYRDLDAMFDDMVQSNAGGDFEDLNQNDQLDIADIICAGDGSTNYEAALQRADQMIFADSQAEGSSREIYFISDGLPTQGADPVPLADSLKDRGATIATMMLEGDPAKLEQMASLDRYGNPYHSFVSNADDLSAALSGLAANDIAGGVLNLRPVGGGSWEKIELLDYKDGELDFSFPTVAVDPQSAPGGLELYLEYWDRVGNLFESWGRLVWVQELEESL